MVLTGGVNKGQLTWYQGNFLAVTVFQTISCRFFLTLDIKRVVRREEEILLGSGAPLCGSGLYFRKYTMQTLRAHLVRDNTEVSETPYRYMCPTVSGFLSSSTMILRSLT